jgi:hypothetical protein
MAERDTLPYLERSLAFANQLNDGPRRFPTR